MQTNYKKIDNAAYIAVMALSLLAMFFSFDAKAIEEFIVVFTVLTLHKYWKRIFAQYRNAQGIKKRMFNYENAEKYFFFDLLLCLLSTSYFAKWLTGSGWIAIIDFLIFATLNSFLVFHLIKRHYAQR